MQPAPEIAQTIRGLALVMLLYALQCLEDTELSWKRVGIEDAHKHTSHRHKPNIYLKALGRNHNLCYYTEVRVAISEGRDFQTFGYCRFHSYTQIKYGPPFNRL